MHNNKHSAPLIVIDGIDGAGKTTQAKLLVDHFQSLPNTQAAYLHFPRYDTFFGRTIARFLAGEFGDMENTSPYLCSITYALDRMHAARDIQKAREAGTIMVTDRYVSSNLAHQGGRFRTPAEQTQFIAWNEELEYEQLAVARESIVLLLDTTPQTATKLRAARGGEQDMLEQDLLHQQATYALYLQLATSSDHWHIIECHRDEGELKTPQEIHALIKEALAASSLAKNG